MKLDLRKVSGSRKNVWWMDAANGQLEYIGEFDNKVIPMAKGVESLNVSVAAGIAMYEVVRQFLAKAK